MKFTINIPCLTIYPRDCAMHGAVQVSLPYFGYVTFMPNHFGKKNWNLTISHNATPWAATVAIGPGQDRRDRLASRVRRALFGFGRASLAWCQEINDVVEMADYMARQYPGDPPVSQRDLDRRKDDDVARDLAARASTGPRDITASTSVAN